MIETLLIFTYFNNGLATIGRHIEILGILSFQLEIFLSVKNGN